MEISSSSWEVRGIEDSSYRESTVENNRKGNENCFELVGGSSYRGFELPGVNCSLL